MLTFVDGATPAQIAAVGDALATLPAAIPGIRDYRFGPDLGINADNCDYVVVADFDSVDDYVAYRDHPSHQRVIAEAIRPILASRATVQYRL
jgi:hypothetical protein